MRTHIFIGEVKRLFAALSRASARIHESDVLTIPYNLSCCLRRHHLQWVSALPSGDVAGGKGASIVGQNIAVINSGTINGGRDQAGVYGTAIRFTGGANSLTLAAGSQQDHGVRGDLVWKFQSIGIGPPASAGGPRVASEVILSARSTLKITETRFRETLNAHYRID